MSELAAKHRAQAIDKQYFDMLAEFNLKPKTMRRRGYITIFEKVDGVDMMTVAKVVSSRPMPKTEITDGVLTTTHYEKKKSTG